MAESGWTLESVCVNGESELGSECGHGKRARQRNEIPPRTVVGHFTREKPNQQKRQHWSDFRGTVTF
jgi:hypothetical protein